MKIQTQPTFKTMQEEEIRKKAYDLAEKRGFAPGHELDDWLQAEREFKQPTSRRPRF